MPEFVPTLQLIGVAVLAVAAVVWTAALLRLPGRTGLPSRAGRATTPLSAVPRQARGGPPLESVELTPAEQDAFAGLARRLAGG